VILHNKHTNTHTKRIPKSSGLQSAEHREIPGSALRFI